MRRIFLFTFVLLFLFSGIVLAFPQDDEMVVEKIVVPRAASGLSAASIMTVCYASNIYTVEIGKIPMETGGVSSGITPRGDYVMGLYNYVDDPYISWGTIYNPEAFIKIWFDISGRIDMNFFHVSVPVGQFCTNYYCGDGCSTWWDCSDVPMNTHVRHEYWRSYCP